MVVEDITRVKDYLTKTKLSTLDFVINPYVGCPMKCLYCYAAYMVSFSKHEEDWGDFKNIPTKELTFLKSKIKRL